MAINPYSDWLGIDKSIASPNYFQLLGVDTKLDDENALIQSVAEKTKLKLAMLAKVDQVKFAEPVAKLKARILKAASVLSDPKLRTDYRIGLSRQSQSGAEAPSSSGLEKVTTTVPSSARPTKSKPTNPVAETLKTPALPPSILKSSSEKSTAARKLPSESAVEDDIPMAIPIRKVQPSLSSTEPPVPSADEVEIEPIPRFLNSTPDGPAAEEAESQFLKKIGTDSLKNRKKNKLPAWAIVLTLLLMTVGIGGLIWSIQFFSNPGNLVSNSTQGTAPPNNPNPILPTDDQKPEAEIETDTETDLDISVEKTGDSEPTDKNAVADDDSQDSNNSTNSTDRDTPDVPSDPSIEQTVKQPGTWDIYFSNRKIRSIRRMLERRDYDKARAEIVSLEKSLERFPKLEIKKEWSPDEKSMEELAEQVDDPLVNIRIDLESVKDASSHIDQFWMTVKTNIASLAPSAELKFDKGTMILVEKIENGLVLRGSGANYEFSLDFLPLSFARQIVEQGTIEDIPTWRLSLAAAIAAENGAVDQLDEIRKLVGASSEDGHDVALLNEFVDFNPTIQVAWERAKMKQGSERKKIIDSFKNQFDYKEIKSLVPTKANQIFDSFFEAEEHDIDVAATLLSEAIELAIQSRDAYRLEDAMVELGGVANIEQTKSHLEQLIKLATAKLKPEQILKLRRVAKKYLNTKSDHSFPRLSKRLTLLLDNLSKEAAIENEGVKSGQLR